MELKVNMIIAGYHKNGNIVLNDSKVPVLVCKGFLTKSELIMDKVNIKTLNHTLLENQTHEVIIEWKDGKLSQAILDQTIYSAVLNVLK